MLGLAETDNTAYSGFMTRYKDGNSNYKLTGLVKNQGLSDYYLVDDIEVDTSDDTKHKQVIYKML